MTIVSVDELQRAWAAVEAGDFRSGSATPRRHPVAAPWQPDEPVVVVAGVAGRVGATTVALGIATAADSAVRVVECGPMHATGLAAATTAELGATDSGWRQGTRDQVLIERIAISLDHPSEVPTPDPVACDLTIIDVGWDLYRVLASDSWLARTIKTAPLVLVTMATVPGVRALDTALRRTGRPNDSWCVVVGPRRKRWPRQLSLAISTSVEVIDARERLATVPAVSTIAMTGITPDPLPPHLVSTCRPIFDQVVESAKGDNHAQL